MLVDGILVFLILWPFARKARPRLAVGAMFTLLYGCARFFTEYFRVPDWETTVPACRSPRARCCRCR
jgi:phosphatidylglycerol:prolipoprotein diacylglycerol transferase